MVGDGPRAGGRLREAFPRLLWVPFAVAAAVGVSAGIVGLLGTASVVRVVAYFGLALLSGAWALVAFGGRCRR